jgi:hypothetical protein
LIFMSAPVSAEWGTTTSRKYFAAQRFPLKPPPHVGERGDHRVHLARRDERPQFLDRERTLGLRHGLLLPVKPAAGA